MPLLLTAAACTVCECCSPSGGTEWLPAGLLQVHALFRSLLPTSAVISVVWTGPDYIEQQARTVGCTYGRTAPDVSLACLPSTNPGPLECLP